MMMAQLMGVAFLLTACDEAIQLERQDRQDTIYEVRGEASALKKFHEEIGQAWTGGTVLDADPSDGMLSYWAYSDRTAAEARALMMPAIFSGFQLEPLQYSETKQFPVERAALDQLAARCGVKADPFFLTPKKSVEITLPAGADAKLSKCLAAGVGQSVKLPITTPRQGAEKK